MVFEEYGFRSFAAMPAQPLSLRAWAAERADLPAAAAGVGVVVDAGFSFTHAVPLCDGGVLWPAVRRINLGGKALTNYLKELVSYRCSPGPMSVWLKSMKSICLYYYHFHCTLPANWQGAWQMSC